MLKRIVLALSLFYPAFACPNYVYRPLQGCEQDYTLMSIPLNSTTVMSGIGCLRECFDSDECNAISICPDSANPGLLTCAVYDTGSDGTCGSLSQVAGCRYMEKHITCSGSKQFDSNLNECVCSPIWMTGPDCNTYYKDCSEAASAGLTDPSEFMTIQIKPDISSNPFEVKCYLMWGGWTQIEKRHTICVDDLSNHDWSMYRDGFGDFSCAFFLGLEKTYQLLKNGNFQLNIYVTGEDGLNGHAYYDNFRLSNAATKYAIDWDSFGTSSAEDGFGYGGTSSNLQGNSFGTVDNADPSNCATTEGVGWWYGDNCPSANLHMPLNTTTTTTGSAAWPQGGILKNLYSFVIQVRRVA